jgi:hypothetical protein
MLKHPKQPIRSDRIVRPSASRNNQVRRAFLDRQQMSETHVASVARTNLIQNWDASMAALLLEGARAPANREKECFQTAKLLG